ncbi:MAG: hypothetical protein ABUS79_08320, partial [Pseudomonadota bacterium]
MRSNVVRVKAPVTGTAVLVGVAALVCGTTGCKRATELTVVVDTEMAVPAELDQVQLTVTGPTGTETPFDLKLGDPVTPSFPMTLGLTPGDQLSPVTIRVAGLRLGVEQVAEVVQTGFVEGESKMVRVVLTAACLGSTCADDQACRLGVCVPRDRPGGTLPAWEGTAPARPGNAGVTIGGRSLWAGAWFTCATKEDTVYCWGENVSKQLSFGDGVEPLGTRHPALGLPRPLRSVGLGAQHGCVCDQTGQAWCWGENDHGQVGTQVGTNDLQDQPRPIMVGGLNTCAQIAGGGSHTCAILTDARVACWGDNSSGQAGQSTSTKMFTTPQLVPNLTGVIDLVAGDSFTCALTTNSVQCWGGNGMGQLGDGTTTARSSPRGVTPQPDRPSRLSAGRYSVCALLSTGKVLCWGENANGLIGDSPQVVLRPVEIKGIADATRLSVGHGQACVVRTGGTASCWGEGQFGQLGNNDKLNSAVPV